MTRDRARLLEVLDAIGRVERHAATGREAFFADDLVHDAVLSRIGSLGESVKGLSPPFKARHPGGALEAGGRHPRRGQPRVLRPRPHRHLEHDRERLPPLKASVECILAEDPEVQA